MSTNLALGILLVIIGGVMEGTYAVSTRYTPRWQWEHIWGAGSLMAVLLVAWPVSFLTVPQLWTVFSEAGVRGLLAPTIFGAAWGAGSIFFGLGVNAVGIAVGVSLILGLIAVVGSLLPMLIYHPEQFAVAGGQLTVGALAVMLVGIVICGVAGHLRQAALQQGSAMAAAADGSSGTVSADAKRPSFKLGLLFCVLSGVLSAMLNFAFITGDNLRKIAVEHGASSMWAPNAIWLLVFTVAYGTFIAYCIVLMVRNHTFDGLRTPQSGKYWLLAAVMGVLWAGGIVVYGVGVVYMGSFGAYAGWPLLLIAAIAASNISGFAIGEWKAAGSKPRLVMISGLGVLMIAAIMLGIANRMLAA